MYTTQHSRIAGLAAIAPGRRSDLLSRARRRSVQAARSVLAAGAIVGAFGGSNALAAVPAPDVYNSTPSCPVSAAHALCGPWDVPVDAANPAAYGQCTYWAIEKRPDLQQAYATYGSLTGGAWDYEVDAVKAGLIVDHTPVVGDAFAEPPGAVSYDAAGWTWTAGPLGHVGYVESVAADGTFVVSEMNGGGIYALHGYVQDLTAASTASMYFIHQAGYTPPPPTAAIASATTHTPAAATSATTPAAPAAATAAAAPVTPAADVSPRTPSLSTRVRVARSVVVVRLTVRAGSGSVTGLATKGRSRVAMTVQSAPGGYVIKALLTRGSWTVQIRFHGASGWRNEALVRRAGVR
jgi:surface antigen